jgi:rSAM/selenodomain-associated transferase 2
LGTAARVSVIIPALDEEAWVVGAVACARAGGDAVEVIVSDGGSRDATRARALGAGAVVVEGRAGRGVQLERGAREATGDWLVFLHADTRLERGWAAALAALPPGAVGGAFRFALDSPRRRYRWLEAAVALRCRLFRLPFGDQALFCRRAVYREVGGFPPWPLMEDVAFVRRLKRRGPLALLPLRALTSCRRFERQGLLGATVRNGWLLGLFALGFSPHRLARLYYGPPSVEG